MLEMLQESAQCLVLLHCDECLCEGLFSTAPPPCCSRPLCLAAWRTSCLRPWHAKSVCQAECCSAGAENCLLPCPACAAVLLALVQCPPAAPAPGVASLPEHCSKVMSSSLVNISKWLALATGLVLFALMMSVFACLQLGSGFSAGWLLWLCVQFCRWIGFILRVLP